jgi:hypothetical protein
MRTTLDIDEDVLLAVKDLARREKSTAGAVLSALARMGLQARTSAVAESSPRYGFAPKPGGGVTVSNAQINALRDALGED